MPTRRTDTGEYVNGYPVYDYVYWLRENGIRSQDIAKKIGMDKGEFSGLMYCFKTEKRRVIKRDIAVAIMSLELDSMQIDLDSYIPIMDESRLSIRVDRLPSMPR